MSGLSNKNFIFIYLFLSLFLLINLNATANPSYKKNLIPISSWTTKNGTRVLFSHNDALPIVDIAVIFDAGSARDGEKYGLAKFTNAMLKEGGVNLSTDAIADNLDQVGAIMQYEVTTDFAAVRLRSLTATKNLNPALKIFTEVLSEPAFLAKPFARVRKQMLSAKKEELQDPDTVASQAFFKALYDNDPYGHPILGNANTINALTVTDLQNFYKTYYVAKDALIVIVGAINGIEAKKIADEITCKLALGNTAPKLKAAKKLAAKKIDIDFPSKQNNIYIGEIGIAKGDPDFYALSLGNYIFGGAALTSRLFQEIRNNNGLAYSISSAFVTLETPGPFGINLQTSNDNSQKALSLTFASLNNFLQNGPSQKELTQAKYNITRQFPLQFVSNSAILNALTLMGFYHLPLDYFDTFIAKINAVTLADVKAAFTRHLDAKEMTVVQVGEV